MRLKTRIDGLSFDARLKALQAVTPSLVTVAGQTTKYGQSLSRRSNTRSNMSNNQI